MWFLVVLASFAYLLFEYFKYATFWDRMGVPNWKPLPIFGNMGRPFLGQQATAYLVQNYYDGFPNKRYIGFYNGTLPCLMIRDPKLIRRIMVKDFDTFPEHGEFVPEGADPLWSNNLFAMRGGKRWHQMRTTLSFSYTNNKMKMMFELIKDCSKKVSQYYLKKEGNISFNLKEIFGKYANDVIVTIAFGVSTDSLKDPKNEFYVNGTALKNFSGLRELKILLFIIVPKLMKALGYKIISEKSSRFFKQIIKDTLQYRRQYHVGRPDMLQQLIQIQKEPLNYFEEDDSKVDVTKESVKNIRNTIQLTDEDITSQAILFYFEGFDATSTMLSHAAFELMINPEAQEQLYQEVDFTLKKCYGEINYEALMNMKYLDMVISETLRKWPPFVLMDRKAVKSFTIEPDQANETPLHFKAGQHILVPVYAIQRDPKYFPNPEKFDPERFNDENKNKITPFTYLPFGAGPRNCIGSRFALLESKLVLAELISKFEFVPVEKSTIPLILGRRNFTPVPDEGFWIGMKARKR